MGANPVGNTRRSGPLALFRTVDRACWALALVAVAVVTGIATGYAEDQRRISVWTAGHAAPVPGALLDLAGRGGDALPRTLLVLAAVAAVAVAGVLVARRRPLDSALLRPVPPVAVAALLISAELRVVAVDAVVSLVGMALVLVALLGPPVRRLRVPVWLPLGVAIALQPQLLLFALVMWLLGGRRQASAGAAFAVVLNLVVWPLHSAATAAYWRGLVEHGGFADGVLDDQSGHAILMRLHLHGAALAAVWAVLVVAVAVFALRRAVRAWQDGQPLLGLAMVGSAALVAAPQAGPGDLAWVLLAAFGRLGRRPEDRALWPVVAVTATLAPSQLFDPNIEPVTTFLLRNAPGLIALLIAVCLPFRHRTDPLWRVKREAAPTLRHPFGRSWLPALPPRLRPLGRPNLMLELLLIQVCYGVYTAVRNAAPNQEKTAVQNGRSIHDIEKWLHIDFEHAVNSWALHYDWLMDISHTYYKTLHFIVPLTVLVWLYVRYPARYRTGRTILFTVTGIALVGFYAVPVAPPRLIPGLGFLESPGSRPDSAPLGALTALTNQYAAMPSLHIGWSSWCALLVFATTKRWWLRALAVAYPCFTFYVIISTANHWIFDALGGLIALALGVGFQYFLTGRKLSDAEPPRPPRTPRASRRALSVRLSRGAPVSVTDHPAPDLSPSPGRRPEPDGDPEPARNTY